MWRTPSGIHFGCVDLLTRLDLNEAVTSRSFHSYYLLVVRAATIGKVSGRVTINILWMV